MDTETDEFLSWDEVKEECKRVDYSVVPTLYAADYLTPIKVQELIEDSKETPFGIEPEGFVIRKENRFKEEDFTKSVTKYVRKGHVQTNEHWSKNWKTAELI